MGAYMQLKVLLPSSWR